MMDFDEISYQAYLDAMAERYDFASSKKCGETYIAPDRECHKGKKDTKTALTPAEFDKALIEASDRIQKRKRADPTQRIYETQGVIDLFNIGKKGQV